MSNKRKTLPVRRGNSGLSRRGSLFDEWLTPFDGMFDQMMEEMFPGFSSSFGMDFFQNGSYPKVDVVDQDDHILIHAAVPGMSKNDIEVEILDGVLSISGKSNQIEEFKDKYVHKEIKRSQFRRSFKLGDNLDTESVEASFEDGFLKLKLPKIAPEEDKSEPVKIEIK